VEVAFVLAKRIDKPITDIADLRPYVKSVHPGFDLPSNRFDGALGPRKVADVIADGAAANRFVLGPPMDPAKLELDKLSIKGTQDGKEVYAGPTSNVMGNPWKALRWLSNTLLRRGFALEAGDVVLSGAVTKMYTPPAGKTAGTYVGDCGALGRVSCKVVGALK
jgi:2-keto-4-pentenoate hydratase